MVNTNRRGMSDGQKFTVVLLFLVGLFIVFCGTGMSNPQVGSLGGAIGVLVPSLIVVASKRNSNQRYAFARAQVLRATTQPITGSRKSQCTMLLFVHAPGIDSVEVLVKDPDVPVDTWPYPGAELPVLIPNGNPRRIKVLWDQVHSDADLAPIEYLYDNEYDTEDFGSGFGPIPEADETSELPGGSPGPPPSEARSGEARSGQARSGQARSGYEAPSAPGVAAEDAATGIEPASPPRRPSPWPRRPPDAIVTGDTVVVAHAPIPRAPIEDSDPIFRATPAPETKSAKPTRDSKYAVAIPNQSTDKATPSADADTHAPSASADTHAPPPPTAAAPDWPVVAETPVLPAVTEKPPVAEKPPESGSTKAPPPADDAFLAAFLGGQPQPANPPGTEPGLHGVSITLIVSSLERSLAFYRDTVGLAEIDSGSGSAVLSSGPARITLRQVPDMQPVDRRVAHLNLEVDDVHAEYNRLKAAGVEFAHRPRVVTRGEQLEQWAATFRDPDGHFIMLTRWVSRR